MSTTPKRTTAEILQEYNNLAYKSGHVQYTIVAHTKELAMINASLQSLSVEHAAAKLEEDKAAAAAKDATASSNKQADASLASTPATEGAQQ